VKLSHKQIDQRRAERDALLLQIRTIKRRIWILGQEILTGVVYVERNAVQLSLLETAQARTGSLFPDESPAPQLQEAPKAQAPKVETPKRRGRTPKAKPAPAAPKAPTPAPAPPAPKKRGRPRKNPTPAEAAEEVIEKTPLTVKSQPQGEPRVKPKAIPTIPQAIALHLWNLGATYTDPEKKGATLAEIADHLKLASETTAERADVARFLHESGAIQYRYRWYHSQHLPSDAPPPSPSLRARLLARLDQAKTYKGPRVLATLLGAPIADVRAQLEQLDREGLLSERGPGSNGQGYLLKDRERRKLPTVRLNWPRAMERIDRFVSKRTRFTTAELRAELDCTDKEAEQAIRVLKESTAIMQSADGWEVMEGLEVAGQVRAAIRVWFVGLVVDRAASEEGAAFPPKQWAKMLELDKWLVVQIASEAIKAKALHEGMLGALIAGPGKKRGKK